MLIFLLYFLCLGFLNVHLLESYYSLTLWTHLQFFDYNSCLKVFLLEPVSKPSWGELVSTGIFFSFSWLEILFSYLFACLSNFCALGSVILESKAVCFRAQLKHSQVCMENIWGDAEREEKRERRRARVMEGERERKSKRWREKTGRRYHRKEGAYWVVENSSVSWEIWTSFLCHSVSVNGWVVWIVVSPISRDLQQTNLEVT